MIIMKCLQSIYLTRVKLYVRICFPLFLEFNSCKNYTNQTCKL